MWVKQTCWNRIYQGQPPRRVVALLRNIRHGDVRCIAVMEEVGIAVRNTVLERIVEAVRLVRREEGASGEEMQSVEWSKL